MVERPGAGADRLVTLDFVKGMLVILMIVYHWLNYFTEWSEPYKYLRFLTPSFSFITGFIVFRVYMEKYAGRSRRIYTRLLERGVKLIVMFASLNLLMAVFVKRSSFHLSMDSILRTLVIGSVGYRDGERTTAFYILLPIGYVLLLSGAVVAASRLYGNAVHVACAGLLVLVVVLDIIGLKNSNVEIVSIGFMGASVGRMTAGRFRQLSARPVVVCVCYFVYLVALNTWNEVFALQVVGVCLSLMIIVVIREWWGEGGIVYRKVLLLGQYSLLAYIGQIVILRAVRSLLGGSDLSQLALLLSFVAALIGTYVVVWGMNRARSEAGIIDRLYGTMFS